MPKEEKKSLKAKQRERQIKQQRAQQAYQAQNERNQKKKSQKFQVQRIFYGVALIVLVLTAYGIWQYYEGQKPPTIGGTNNDLPTTGSAPNFSLADINGTSVALSQFNDKVIGIHFMSVGCGGQIYPVNEYQLAQIKSVCTSYCGKGNESASFLTVAVATCENSALDQIRSNYGVTWPLGNDYADSVLDIVNAYVPYEIGDGSIVLIDKNFNVAQVFSGGVDANTLSSKINQLLEA